MDAIAIAKTTGSQTTDGNATQCTNNTASRVYGTAVGAGYRFSPATVAGRALGGGGTNFSVANRLCPGRSDLIQAGAFVRDTVGHIRQVGYLQRPDAERTAFGLPAAKLAA